MANRPIPAKITPAIIARARKIRVLLMDVDGVLTDGRIWLLSQKDGQQAKSSVSTRTMARD